LEFIESILDANEELVVIAVLFVVVIDAASDELLEVILLCSPSIFNAALELFVVTVP
jgi:hypothetical protein